MNHNIELVFKTLGDPKRIEILKRLSLGETCSCTLINNLDITQPTLSHHLKTLSTVGLTQTYKVKNNVNHHINIDMIDEMISFLTKLKQQNREKLND